MCVEAAIAVVSAGGGPRRQVARRRLRRATGAAMLGPGALLLHAGSANARGRETLIQPSEIRSGERCLAATITAAPGRVQAGRVRVSRFLYNGAYLPPCSGRASATRCGSPSGTILPDDPSNCTITG